MFKRQVENVPDAAELLNIYQLLLQHHREEERSDRDKLAVQIYKTYLDPHSGNALSLDGVIDHDLRHSLMTIHEVEDGPRPTSSSLTEFRRVLGNKFSIDRQNFVKKQSEQLGVDASALLTMSSDVLKQRIRQAKADLAMAKQREGRVSTLPFFVILLVLTYWCP